MIPMEGREYGNGLTPGQTGIDWLSRHDLIRQDFPRRVLEPKAGRMRVDLPLEIAGRHLRHRGRKIDSRVFVGMGHRYFSQRGGTLLCLCKMKRAGKRNLRSNKALCRKGMANS